MWLIYFCNTFDVSHVIDEIKKTEDAILDAYDTKEERSFSDYQQINNGVLGGGGFGIVHLYQHNNTDEQIAVKELKSHPNETTKEDKAFEVEVRIMRELSRFDHPNIVRYFFEHTDVGSGKFYIGMEYMTGGSLAGKIKKTPLPEDDLRHYTHQILCGVKFLHEKHIAHRDIKPANVLLSLDDPIIKLADFGISRKLEASLLTHGATTAGKGTVQYMSPEATRGEDDEKKGYGLKTDIWSVGCVVLEMAKGTRPWSESINAGNLMFRIGNGEAPPVAENVPGDVKDFLKKTFILVPKDRASADDLLEDKLLAGITSDDSGNVRLS
ncbi:uncharacterized protein LOC135499120 [Lineus longissimus]|uniref:uncharacterized protein LOC135499120 n=1 Tax=Lineus longissimus TaxID=88925 RepID=UPI002B4CCA2D